jgi:hypothetical protein
MPMVKVLAGWGVAEEEAGSLLQPVGARQQRSVRRVTEAYGGSAAIRIGGFLPLRWLLSIFVSGIRCCQIHEVTAPNPHPDPLPEYRERGIRNETFPEHPERG